MTYFSRKSVHCRTRALPRGVLDSFNARAQLVPAKFLLPCGRVVLYLLVLVVLQEKCRKILHRSTLL